MEKNKSKDPPSKHGPIVVLWYKSTTVADMWGFRLLPKLPNPALQNSKHNSFDFDTPFTLASPKGSVLYIHLYYNFQLLQQFSAAPKTSRQQFVCCKLRFFSSERATIF